MTTPTERIILGIDPGTAVMGFGVLAVELGKVRLLEAGAIRFRAAEDHALKLRTIFLETTRIIERHKPDELAIEAQFFGKNVQSMLKLGRAQGVAIAAALHRELAVTEYAPKRVKQSITGNGNASKEQVAAMLLSILALPALPSSTDATDAVAVALCHHFAQGAVPRSGRSKLGGKGGWGAFVRNNPDRVK
ncbi:MAG: crossover junction endodeoxyribonuclease RuvC [Flavobacteriales bacterium]|nr:crossover junction endodeoxyribonuclease RuvC [Flavobacteriales bacterium]